MPRKAAKIYEKKACPTCHKEIDIRGYNTHLRTHTKAIEAAVGQHNTQQDAYRRGYRDGWKDGRDTTRE